jgi:hypothetical protein
MAELVQELWFDSSAHSTLSSTPKRWSTSEFIVLTERFVFALIVGTVTLLFPDVVYRLLEPNWLGSNHVPEQCYTLFFFHYVNIAL